MNAITTVLFCHDIFSHEYPQKVKDVIKKTQQKMEQKKYTRSELLKYIRMNKPTPNHPVADSYWCGLSAEQNDYLVRSYKTLTVADSGNTQYRILLGNSNDAIITHEGYILPYEPKEKPPFDLELEKHQYMKDQIDKVMAQYKGEECETGLPPSVNVIGSYNPLTTTQAAYTRETFLTTLAATLTAAEINVSVGIAEKIFKLYNLVQVYGGGVTMDQINKIKSEL